ncbi:MAG: GGDEF domain-containing protein [Candidatus Ventricola sp.]
MLPYYTIVTFSLCVGMAVFAVLVYENDRFSREKKAGFLAACVGISVAVLAEWASIALNGTPARFIPLHAVVKAADYIVSPLAGVMFANQVQPNRKYRRLAYGVLAASAVIQIISIFTGWTFYIDAQNYYHHGPLYVLYAAVFVAAYVYSLYAFMSYSRTFRRHNYLSLIMIFLFLTFGIALQEIFGGNFRTLGISLVMGSILLYVHYCEFSQIERDDVIRMQRELLDTDTLTGLYSRYAYTGILNGVAGKRPAEDLVVISVDVNGLKWENDHNGHLAGDELLQGAADCLGRVLSPYGKCYRTGGDEFIALLRLPAERMPVLCDRLSAEAAAWQGKLVKRLSLAIGYAAASEHPDSGMEELISLADQMMYGQKATYYRCNGRDRRKR